MRNEIKWCQRISQVENPKSEKTNKNTFEEPSKVTLTLHESYKCIPDQILTCKPQRLSAHQPRAHGSQLWTAFLAARGHQRQQVATSEKLMTHSDSGLTYQADSLEHSLFLQHQNGTVWSSQSHLVQKAILFAIIGARLRRRTLLAPLVGGAGNQKGMSAESAGVCIPTVAT